PPQDLNRMGQRHPLPLHHPLHRVPLGAAGGAAPEVLVRRHRQRGLAARMEGAGAPELVLAGPLQHHPGPLRELRQGHVQVQPFQFAGSDFGHGPGPPSGLVKLCSKGAFSGVLPKTCQAPFGAFLDFFELIFFTHIMSIVKLAAIGKSFRYAGGQFIPACRMTPEEKQFLKALGARITAARKAQGLSQEEVASALGVAQQTYAHYEVGYARIQVAALFKLAKFLRVSADALLGIEGKTRSKAGPPPRFQGQLERLTKIGRADQKFVLNMVDALLTSAERKQAKKRAKQGS